MAHLLAEFIAMCYFDTSMGFNIKKLMSKGQLMNKLNRYVKRRQHSGKNVGMIPAHYQ